MRLNTDEAQTDGITQYIEWATKNGFGVIDINVPRYITHPEVRLPW
jgi:hypothetical protein